MDRRVMGAFGASVYSELALAGVAAIRPLPQGLRSLEDDRPRLASWRAFIDGATERAIGLEPYGLDISWRLAALARRRLPHWSDRIWVGNVMHWTAPRRFDVVHTGIDYVPHDHQRELLGRLLRELVVPGGRVVLRAARVDTGEPDIVTQVRALGFDIGGVFERVHPQSGALRRTVWLAG